MGTLGAAAPACAGWRVIAANQPSGISQIGLQRTADGVLHLAWVRPASSRSAGNAALFTTAIEPGGQLGQRSTIASGWSEIGDADLVRAPGGKLEVFFNAQHSGSPSDPLDGLISAFGNTSGATWGTPFLVTSKDSAYAGTPSVALTPQEVPLESWANPTAYPVVHRALDPSTGDYLAAGQGEGPNLATDTRSGATVLAWYGFRTPGIFVQLVDAGSGSPIGAAHQLSNSSHDSSDFSGRRLPLVARPGGGLFVAADTGTFGVPREVRLWKLGGGSVRLASSSQYGFHNAALAAGSDGRVWVAWTRDHTAGIFVRGSNPSLTGWSPTRRISIPAGVDVTELDADARAGRLDLIARFRPVSATQISLQATQVTPGLTLTAQPQTFSRRQRTTVRFTVTDGGTPVPGAIVQVGGSQAKTNASGTASLKLGPYSRAKRLTATATRPGYASARITLRATG
jgi:hypothetical protein